MKSYVLSKISYFEKQEFQKKMSMHYFAIDISFQRIKDIYLVQTVKILRLDDGLLPTRKQLATSLLDKCHEDLKEKIDVRMKGSVTCLTTDGWSNIKND